MNAPRTGDMSIPHVMDTTHTCHLAPTHPHTVATCFIRAEITPDRTILHGVKCDGWPITVTIMEGTNE